MVNLQELVRGLTQTYIWPFSRMQKGVQCNLRTVDLLSCGSMQTKAVQCFQPYECP